MDKTKGRAPINVIPIEGRYSKYDELTKREYFAAKAMSGRLSRDAHHDSEEIAEQAVEDADALIKELNE